MRAARIEGGVVMDLWDVPALEVYPELTLVEAPDWVQIGASWDGATFVNPPPPPPPVPASITARQLRLWLVRNGVPLAAVAAAIAALDEPTRTEAQIEWDHATQFERSHPLLTLLGGTVLGLDGAALDAALDAAFAAASSL